MDSSLCSISLNRLHSQQLLSTTISSPQKMVEWFGGIQGQEYTQTLWGLGLRLPKLRQTNIEQELSEGKILRTHLFRPTWHLVSSRDIRWLLQLTAPRVNAANAYMYKKLELDQSVFSTCNTIISKTLSGNIHLTRDEINHELKKNKIEAQGHRLSYIMMRAELDGIICSGDRRGLQFTYALLDERVPSTKTLENDEALVELTKRYFQSRSPAMVTDFATWSGLTLKDCRRGIEILKADLTKDLINGDEYISASGMTLEKEELHKMYLLPIYDEFIMGYKDRSPILEYKNKLGQKTIFSFDCMIIYGGQIIGTWKRTIGRKSINIKLDFFEQLNRVQKDELEKAISRFEEFNCMPVAHSMEP